MIYRQKNKKWRTTKFFLSFLLLFLVLRFFNNPIAVQLFNYPVNYILDSTSIFTRPIKHSILYFKEKDDLQATIDELRRQNLELTLNQIIQQSNVQEFEYFVNTFGTYTPTSNLVRVITKPPFMSFDLIRIAGQLESYNVDDLVYYKTILIGKIIEKNNAYATVQLFSSPDQKTPVVVRGIQFEAIGLGGGRYVFEVAKDFEIAEKDIILFAEKNTSILGVIELLDSKPEDLFKKVYFNIPVALSDISYVSIEHKQNYEQDSNNN